MGYRETYAAISDEDLMNVAADIASLEDEARLAITIELNRRHISESDIARYRGEVAAFNPKEFWGVEEYIARSFNGCGTMIFGKRDFWPDGSHVTTKWVTVFFIPVWPLQSMCVKTVKQRWFQPDLYLVRERRRPCWRQVGYIWSYSLLLLLAIPAIDLGEFGWILLAVASVLPWTLRKLARAKVQRFLAENDPRAHAQTGG